ncbi:hypothetical protein DL771_008063 [Monosporascus sp. 5C6A]|nr:hypothetical protein DL771_008063 [Monosporascus sp. 5C6A]
MVNAGSKPPPSTASIGRGDYLTQEAVRHAMENHGIRNLTLYGVGVALLEIGLWARIPWEDHVQVRRKTARLSFLGRQYRAATKRLIDCDFGLAIEDINDPRLQNAIFQSSVAELESLLSKIQVDDDS